MSEKQTTLLPLFDQVLNKLQAGAVLLDSDLKVCFWNEWMAQHSEINAEDILGKTLTEVFAVDEESYLLKRARHAIELGLSSILSNTIHRHPLPLYSVERKEELLEQKLILSRLKSGDDNFCLVHVYDVSDALRREKSLKRQAKKLSQTIHELTEAEQQIRAIFDLSPDGIMVLDQDGQLKRINAAAEKMFEIYEYPDLYNFLQFIDDLDLTGNFEKQFFSGISGHVTEKFSLTGRSLSGKTFPLEVSVLKVESEDSLSFSVICRDITERQQAEKRLRKLAHFDSLTGLANRATFNDRLKAALKNAARNDQVTALIYVDLDNLKPVNDQLGHRAGDILLREIANRLRKSVRDTDTVARIGGDEFTIIINEDNEHGLPDLGLISGRLLEKIKKPLVINGETLEPSASIGITIGSSNDPDELVKHADTAMYTAKQQGKGRCVFYDSSLDSERRK